MDPARDKKCAAHFRPKNSPLYNILFKSKVYGGTLVDMGNL